MLGLVYYLPLFLQGVLGESATNSGEVITPMTVSLVIGSTAGGLLVAQTGRYQWIAIIGGALISVGAFLLLAHGRATTPILQAAVFMIVAGVGLGIFFAILTLAVQNAIPRTCMGVGTSARCATCSRRAIRWAWRLSARWSTTRITSDIAGRLPAGAQRLTPAGLAAATNPQVLVNPTYRDTLVQTAKGYAARAAVAQAEASGKIPPSGPGHDAAVAAITQQAQAQTAQLLQQVFDALKQSLAVGIQHGFIASFLIGLLVLVAACFLKDVPLSKSFREEPAQTQGDAEPSSAGAVDSAQIP